jgi:uncharacterized protein (UPF0297 family)
VRQDQLFETQKICVGKNLKTDARPVMRQVYDALSQKGYDPINQIVGYLVSGDPTYITAHNNARNLINRLNRDDLLEEIVSCYLDEK